VRIQIEGFDLPGGSCGPGPDFPGGHHHIHVGVQHRNREKPLLGLVPGDAALASWALDCTATRAPAGIDLKGPYIQGSPGGRFIYLNWLAARDNDDDSTLTMFRRAKLQLDAVPPEVLDAAVSRGLLIGRLGLTDPHGHPTCASVRPPLITWTS
jgi:hypothetical protein